MYKFENGRSRERRTAEMGEKLVDNVDMWITLSTACGYVDNLIVGIFRKFDKFRIYFQKICRAIFLAFFGLVTDVRAPS